MLLFVVTELLHYILTTLIITGIEYLCLTYPIVRSFINFQELFTDPNITDQWIGWWFDQASNSLELGLVEV